MSWKLCKADVQMANKRELQESSEAKDTWSRRRSGKETKAHQANRGKRNGQNQTEISFHSAVTSTCNLTHTDTETTVKYEDERIMKLWRSSSRVGQKVRDGRRYRRGEERCLKRSGRKRKKEERQSPPRRHTHCEQQHLCQSGSVCEHDVSLLTIKTKRNVENAFKRKTYFRWHGAQVLTVFESGI